MDYLYEKVAYLKGFVEGLEVSDESKEGKAIHKIVDVLEDFATAINDLNNDKEDLLEEDTYSNEESFIEMECPSCGDLANIEEDVLYDESLDIICPNCNSIILSAEEGSMEE